jgi:hypothetical protein
VPHGPPGGHPCIVSWMAMPVTVPGAQSSKFRDIGNRYQKVNESLPNSRDLKVFPFSSTSFLLAYQQIVCTNIMFLDIIHRLVLN